MIKQIYFQLLVRSNILIEHEVVTNTSRESLYVNLIPIKIFCVQCSNVTSTISVIVRSNRGVEMSPAIRSPTILLFFLLYAYNAICRNILEPSEILDQFPDNDLSRSRRNSEDESPIWMEYEFGTGAGNREGIIQDIISFTSN